MADVGGLVQTARPPIAHQISPAEFAHQQHAAASAAAVAAYAAHLHAAPPPLMQAHPVAAVCTHACPVHCGAAGHAASALYAPAPFSPYPTLPAHASSNHSVGPSQSSPSAAGRKEQQAAAQAQQRRTTTNSSTGSASKRRGVMTIGDIVDRLDLFFAAQSRGLSKNKACAEIEISKGTVGTYQSRVSEVERYGLSMRDFREFKWRDFRQVFRTTVLNDIGDRQERMRANPLSSDARLTLMKKIEKENVSRQAEMKPPPASDELLDNTVRQSLVLADHAIGPLILAKLQDALQPLRIHITMTGGGSLAEAGSVHGRSSARPSRSSHRKKRRKTVTSEDDDVEDEEDDDEAEADAADHQASSDVDQVEAADGHSGYDGRSESRKATSTSWRAARSEAMAVDRLEAGSDTYSGRAPRESEHANGRKRPYDSVPGAPLTMAIPASLASVVGSNSLLYPSRSPVPHALTQQQQQQQQHHALHHQPPPQSHHQMQPPPGPYLMHVPPSYASLPPSYPLSNSPPLGSAGLYGPRQAHGQAQQYAMPVAVVTHPHLAGQAHQMQAGQTPATAYWYPPQSALGNQPPPSTHQMQTPPTGILHSQQQLMAPPGVPSNGNWLPVYPGPTSTPSNSYPQMMQQQQQQQQQQQAHSHAIAHLPLATAGHHGGMSSAPIHSTSNTLQYLIPTLQSTSTGSTALTAVQQTSPRTSGLPSTLSFTTLSTSPPAATNMAASYQTKAEGRFPMERA